jgi:hypothetical protein
MSKSTKDTRSAVHRRASHANLRDPALWAWLIVALLALLPARAALHVLV